MRTLHIISHTHWDREWHEPFQIFRLRLVEAIDKMLSILARDPDYRYFMLDGQTIVLEDYIEVRPERQAELRDYIQKGRILVGPWYVLPDEFLVSGEAIIRNLQRGIRIANEYGRSMPVGYIPDPFGHISQIPQILKGFGIDVAMFRRGLADEPTELWWEGADGTRTLTTYLRDGYDNAAWLPQNQAGFTATLELLAESLAPFDVSGHMLMMHGTDHMQPWEGLPERMRQAEGAMPGTRIVHSNLPAYAQAVVQSLTDEERAELPWVRGELRNPKRHHLLPGVTSARGWIKQRNMAAQILLEQWAEPLAAAAMNLPARPAATRSDLRPDLALAWKYLLQNHPHDSICGCSVDQVHDEMRLRFDWVEQIGGDIVRRMRDELVEAVDTVTPGAGRRIAVVVFNAGPAQRVSPATAEVDLPGGWESCQVVDEGGRVVPSVVSAPWVEDYEHVTASASQLRWTFGAAQSGNIGGYRLRDFDWRIEDEDVYADVTVSNQGERDMAVVQRGLEQLARLVADPRIKMFHLRVHSPRKVTVEFNASALPGYGFKTYWLRPTDSPAPPAPPSEPNRTSIENEFLRIEANPDDGTLTITDKITGTVFPGANRFVDGGDRGDLYDYSAPERDALISTPAGRPRIAAFRRGQIAQELTIESVLRVPASLAADRAERSAEMVELPVSARVTLYDGLRRADFHTGVENRARDHRLRVLFPTPIHTAVSLADQAFDLVARPVELPQETASWVEQPIGTLPLQKFVTVRDDENGVVLATRGLMEYEALPEAGDGTGVTIALTLLRCVGWLSRPDLHNRQGNAGPEKRTPGAQELGPHEFDYSLIPYAPRYIPGLEGGIDEAERPLTWREARAAALGFAVPAQAVATDEHTGTLPARGGWVTVLHPDFLITAIKPPAEGEGMVVRGYNARQTALVVRLKPFRPFARAARTDLNETAVQALEVSEEGEVEVQVRPREILTVRFGG